MEVNVINLTLKKLRLLRGVSQKAVIELLNSSETGFRNKENGRNELTFKEARELAKFYNVSLDEMAVIADNTLKENEK